MKLAGKYAWMKVVLFFVSVSMALTIVSVLTGCQKYGNVVKILDQYNNPTSRYWKEFILKYGIDAQDSDGNTILAVAIEGPNYALAEAVLKNKFNPNKPAKGNLTAIHYVWRLYDFTDGKNRDMLPFFSLLMNYKASPFDDDNMFNISVGRWNLLSSAIWKPN